MRLKGCLFQTVGWGCCCGNPFHGSGTSEHQGGAWRRPGRQQAHRCPGPSSCLPCQIKSGLLFSPFPPPNVHINLPRPFHFSVSSLFSSPFFFLAFDQGLDLLVEWQRQEVLGGTGGAGGAPGPGPVLSTVLSVSQACVIPGLAWPGPVVTEPGFQPWLSSQSICQSGPVTTAQAHGSQRKGGRGVDTKDKAKSTRASCINPQITKVAPLCPQAGLWPLTHPFCTAFGFSNTQVTYNLAAATSKATIKRRCQKKSHNTSN